MSLILDALKKLEQEKIARRGKGVEIGPAILKGRTRRPPSRWKFVAALTTGVLVLAGVAGVYLSNKSAHPPLTPKAPEAAIVAAPATSVAPPREVAPAPMAGALPPEPAGRRQEGGTVARPAPLAPSPPTAGMVPSAGALTDLKVSGIAWQDERSARRAVVNGLLVGEGATVAGARITEILPDRIRVSLGGQSAEIPFATPFTGR